MMLAAFVLAQEIAQCAPAVGSRTMAAIVAVESGGDPLAIGDNTMGRSFHVRDRIDAESLSLRLIQAGHSVDFGLMQINDANLGPLGLSVRSVFDPCVNLRAGETILRESYVRATQMFGTGQRALRAALSAYNTGRFDAGHAYVRRVLLAAGVVAAERRVGPAPYVGRHVILRIPKAGRDTGTTSRRRRSFTNRSQTPNGAPIVILGRPLFSGGLF